MDQLKYDNRHSLHSATVHRYTVSVALSSAVSHACPKSLPVELYKFASPSSSPMLTFLHYLYSPSPLRAGVSKYMRCNLKPIDSASRDIKVSPLRFDSQGRHCTALHFTLRPVPIYDPRCYVSITTTVQHSPPLRWCCQ